jgi:hypothetical protein
MSCCGQRRAQLSGSAPTRPGGTAPRTDDAAPGQRPVLRLVYEYMGPSALTVSSPHTGRRYRFDRPGARIEVDPRDRPLVAQLPQLRRVT